MRARSIDPKRAAPSTGLMTAAMLTATLIAFDAAQAQERAAYIQPSAATVMAAVQPIDSAHIGLDPANSLESEPWDSFRHTVAGAATSSCFGSDALPHEELAVEGLLRLPFLVHAAATSACR